MSKKRLHLSLHDAKEDEDVWLYLRQLTGMEAIGAARIWARSTGKWRAALGEAAGSFDRSESELVNASFLRWSEAARSSGLLSTTELVEVSEDGKLHYRLSNGDSLVLSLDDLAANHDVWRWFADLSRIPASRLGEAEEEKNADPWVDNSWRRLAGEMWQRGSSWKDSRHTQANDSAEDGD